VPSLGLRSTDKESVALYARAGEPKKRVVLKGYGHYEVYMEPAFGEVTPGDRFAEVFAAGGLGALVFNNRSFGASEGEPGQDIDPWAQVRDYRDAITFAGTLAEVDRSRIGVWGSSCSGGHILVVGAIDRRVKCVVSQVPLISGHRNARRLIRSDFIAAVQAQFAADRQTRYVGKAPAMIPVVAQDPMAPCALPTPDSWQWFTETGKARAPVWRNKVTLRSVEMFTEYEPGAYIVGISRGRRPAAACRSYADCSRAGRRRSEVLTRRGTSTAANHSAG
jgi:hypothetical protein